MKNKTLIVIVGPTAIGKTSLSIKLANLYQTEILSADSRQFFKEMVIGTAKPTNEELSQAKHHFVDFLSIHEEYNAGDFEKEAIELTEKLFQEKDTLILVGGSGMYVKSVCEGLDDFPSSKEIRNQLIEDLEEKGIEFLQNKLLEMDPIHYNNMDIHNPQRLIRALEVNVLSDIPYSQLRKNSKVSRPFDIIKIGIKADREILYSRINQRVDSMVEAGLFEEVEALYADKQCNALITVGYREIFDYMDGKHSKNEAIDLIKRNTRRFSKRQMTWFNKDKEINWFDYRDQKIIVDFLESKIHKV